jgi:hypothetical protein
MTAFFTYAQGIILIKLLLAHFVNDFTLQPNSWVKDKLENKYRSIKLYIHSFGAGLLAYIFVGHWDNWLLPVIIMTSHAIIDNIKLSLGLKHHARWFMLDQLAHLLVLLFVWIVMFCDNYALTNYIKYILTNYTILKITLGYFICVFPSGKIIEVLTQNWRTKIHSDGYSLDNAGKYIGMFERALILTFILLQQYTAIGFLIGAKSILRFGEKERKQMEYVLIGTLISFSIALLIGILVINF